MNARAASILPLSLESVSYDADGHALIRDVSFTFAQNTRTIILGPNGAGKSLLLRLCHGLIAPSRGRIVWQGAQNPDQARWSQAMVFQRPVMLRRSVSANVDYALSLRAIPRAQRQPVIDSVLAKTGLSALAQRAARTLSGGEQQRLALARAWALSPQILFLDEPTANLDPAATKAVESIIRGIHDDGAAIVMTTHDLGQAKRLAEHIVFLNHGTIAEHGPVRSFFDQPATAPARAFLEGKLLW